MRTAHRVFLFAFPAVVASLLPFSMRTQACAVATPPGARIGIAGEEVLIVWNPATHTEHFIRRASFEGQAPQFGFLVPTPTPPHLAETDTSTFSTLAQTYHPRFVPHPEYGLKLSSLTGLLFPTFSGAPGRARSLSTGGAERVSVLDSEQVAGYDAIVLRADDPTALAKWLVTHGDAAQPALAAWLQPYVTRHWAITAFKMAKPDARQRRLSSATVEMSFTTDRPFYPYSEPEDQRDGHQQPTDRLLRIFFVGPVRMDGALDSAATRWPGKAHWAEALSPAMYNQVLATGELLQDHTPSTLWLTAFEDKSSPRPGVADLYFSPAAQQTPLVPTVLWPEDRRWPIPIELLIAGGVFAVSQWRKRQEKQQRIAVSAAIRAPSVKTLP